MIVCLNCGKENQDHYKFCLGCGAKLPGPGAATSRSAQRPPIAQPTAPKTVVSPPKKPEAAPAPAPAPAPAASIPSIPSIRPPAPAPAVPASAPTPSGISSAAHGSPSPAAPPPPVSAAAPTPAAQAAPAPCSQCGMANPPGFRFCGNCGNRLSLAAAPEPAPPPPQPVFQAAPVATGPTPTGRARLTLIRIDGSEGGSIEIEGGPTTFGRLYGAPFDGDFYLSPRHCSFSVFPDGVKVDDIAGGNGVYRKLEGRTDLQDGDMFRVGQELLHYEDLPEPAPLDDGTERMGSPNPGYWGRVSVLIDGKIPCESHPIAGDEFIIGRERGDLTFPLDGYVSSSHCRIVGDDSGVFLEDRGSSNGTYVRLRPGTTVPYGALILAGQQLFRIDRVS